MKTGSILKTISVPTGHIIIMKGDYGELELLSLGDYGQDKNIKASFLGLDRNVKDVPHQELLPLEKKWVITVSTQYGCRQYCRFCDVPKVGRGMSATFDDLFNQIKVGLSLHPEVMTSERLNIHYARMGEPTYVGAVLHLSEQLLNVFPNYNIHPVVSTMMPATNILLKTFLTSWMNIKNNIYDGNAGLQLSINSTNDDQRDWMFRNMSLDLPHISEMMKALPKPKGRKITLNFAVADWVINAKRLARLFNPTYFMVKLTPMHRTVEAVKHGIETLGDSTSSYPYEEHEYNLKQEGFDVLVFLASDVEDKSRTALCTSHRLVC